MRAHALVYGLIVAASAAVLASPSEGFAQARATTDDDQAYLESLQKEEPTLAERYVKLRDARAQALGELRKVETQYQNAGPQLRGLFVNQLKQARRRYAETSLALLEFFDTRDRQNIARYQDEVGKLNALIEERKRTRVELEKLLSN